MSRFSTGCSTQIQNNPVFASFNLHESLLHKHRTGFLNVIGSGMKDRIQGIRGSFVQKYSGFAPGNSFRSGWNIEFEWIGSQTDSRNLIDGLNKTIVISWKLIFYSLNERNWQYFGCLFDDFLSFLLIFAGKINGLSLINK